MSTAATAGLPSVEDDDAPVPTRPGPAFRRRTLTIPAQETVPYVAEHWQGAIVMVECGSVDLCCVRGGRRWRSDSCDDYLRRDYYHAAIDW